MYLVQLYGSIIVNKSTNSHSTTFDYRNHVTNDPINLLAVKK